MKCEWCLQSALKGFCTVMVYFLIMWHCIDIQMMVGLKWRCYKGMVKHMYIYIAGSILEFTYVHLYM